MPNICRVLNVWDGGLVFHRRCCRWVDVGSYCCVVGMILICVSFAVATVILYYVVDKYNLVCRLSKDVVCNVRNIDGRQQKLYTIIYTHHLTSVGPTALSTLFTGMNTFFSIPSTVMVLDTWN